MPIKTEIYIKLNLQEYYILYYLTILKYIK